MIPFSFNFVSILTIIPIAKKTSCKNVLAIFSGLNFKLIDKKSLKELKEEKAFLSKMESNEHQIALLKQIDDKIKSAHEDTKNLNDLIRCAGKTSSL